MHDRTVRARTATGIVEGFTRDGVHRWRSIPYARPPVGDLRFRAPQPAQPWSGVRHCHGFANCAPQQRRYTLLGLSGLGGRYQPMSEDCLTLNVVTPEAPAEAAAGHGVHPRRRLFPGQLGDTAVRRGGAGPARVRLRVGELSPGCAGLRGLLVAVDAGNPPGEQPVPARPGAGVAVGARQHRRVRRRPGQRHDLRGERRRLHHRHAAGRPGRQRPVRPSDFGKPGLGTGAFPGGRRRIREPLRQPARCAPPGRGQRADAGVGGPTGQDPAPADRRGHAGQVGRLPDRARGR